MTLSPHKHRWYLMVVALVVMLSLAFVLSPWNQWIGAELKRRLEAQGLQNVELTVSSVGLKSITLKDLSIGQNPPLSMQDVTLDYSLSDLLSGSAKSLSLKGLNLQILRQKGVWGIGGITMSSEGTFEIPVSRGEIADIPVEAAKIESSVIQVQSDAWQMNAPLRLKWQKAPVPALSYEGQNLDLNTRDLTINTGKTTATATLDEGVWKGEWQIKDIKVAGAQAPIPPLQGEGHLKAFADRIEIEGGFASSDKSYKSAFEVQYDLKASEKSAITISNIIMPWNEGTLSAQKILIPLKTAADISIDLNVQRVSADALLQQLTGKKASASGNISGTLPITWKKDGSFVVRQGTLNSEGPGIIKMAPDAIPSDNPQVAVVRDVLTDFHYTTLSIQIESDPENHLSMRMTLEGRNPNAQAGRPVKLSVNLAGDVLGFVQQNLMWLTDPRKFLEQGNDAKN